MSTKMDLNFKKYDISDFVSLKVYNALQSVEKTMVRRQLSNYTRSSIHLTCSRSYFKFIPILRGDINLNSEPITAIYINKSWDDLPICNSNLSINLA